MNYLRTYKDFRINESLDKHMSDSFFVKPIEKGSFGVFSKNKMHSSKHCFYESPNKGEAEKEAIKLNREEKTGVKRIENN